MSQGVLMGFLMAQQGETVLREPDEPPYIEAANDSHVKACILACVALVFTAVACGFATNGVVMCYTSGLANTTNLAEYVCGLDSCTNVSLTQCVRREPYLTTDLDLYGMCRDDVGVTIAFAAMALALIVVDILVAAWHEGNAITDWTRGTL